MGFRSQLQVDRLRLPDGKSDAYFFDDECPGLSVRLQGKAKSWVVWYAIAGRRRRIGLGPVVGIPLRQARADAARIRGGAREGKDPLAEREIARDRAENTLRRLIDAYLEKRAKPRQRPSTFEGTKRFLLTHWAPLHEKPIDSISRLDVSRQLERIMSDVGPTAANRARVHLGAAFSWALTTGRAESNPIVGTRAPAEERRRERVLSPEELRLVWRACERAGQFGLIVRLLALTGQRRHEVAELKWSELDLERALWVIPAARAKNKREHVVPLPPQAVALLPEGRAGREYVFGNGSGGFSGFSRAKARLDNVIAAIRVVEMGEAPQSVELSEWRLPPWALHDLRHTVVTWMSEIGISPHVVEAVVNHVSGSKGGIAGRYNHAELRQPKREALERYAAWVETIVNLKPDVRFATNLRSDTFND